MFSNFSIGSTIYHNFIRISFLFVNNCKSFPFMRCHTTGHVHYFLCLFIYDRFNYILPPENPRTSLKEIGIGILKKYGNQIKQSRSSQEEAQLNIQSLLTD